MDEIRLVEPETKYADEIWAFRREIFDHDAGQKDRFAGCLSLDVCNSAEDWIKICELRKSGKTCAQTGTSVPSHMYLAIRLRDDRLVGMIDLRHHIDHPILGMWGGHCGYSVRPSERGKGYAAEMLRLNLQNARALGIPRLLITCDTRNKASERTILANGGIYEKTIEVEGCQIKRYWITISCQMRYEGVFPACKKNGEPYFRASLTFRRKHISLGSFATAEDAHAAYLEGKQVLSDPACVPERYRSGGLLPFEKWVCLANFRDNGLYLRNPIYVGKKLFYYYLSPSHVLKFDPDDLFYYSSHKIMCRGGHYFVADYGLQVSIASRYGIRSYAREGKDYLFINGDPTDFRRENLKILTVYRGITLEQKKGRPLYTVRIHVRGNVLVGRYPDETEAAVAYNKAADTLRANGLKRNFITNYIEGLSPSRYAELYASVKISPRILSYRF